MSYSFYGSLYSIARGGALLPLPYSEFRTVKRAVAPRSKH